MTAPTPDPTTASVGGRERLIEAILATRWPNGDRFNGVNEWTAGMIADSILANHAAPTVDGATVDEAAVAAILAAHGWEWGDGLEMLQCDCGWSIDGYIGHEEGLAERDAANAMTEGREVPAVIRHRAHVAQMIAATVPTSPTDTGGTDDGLRAALTALLDDPSPPRFDKDGNYLGLVSGNSDAHRTVGKHRAWSDTSEWCYPEAPCRACSEPVDQADLRAVLEAHKP